MVVLQALPRLLVVPVQLHWIDARTHAHAELLGGPFHKMACRSGLRTLACTSGKGVSSIIYTAVCRGCIGMEAQIRTICEKVACSSCSRRCRERRCSGRCPEQRQDRERKEAIEVYQLSLLMRSCRSPRLNKTEQANALHADAVELNVSR